MEYTFDNLQTEVLISRIKNFQTGKTASDGEQEALQALVKAMVKRFRNAQLPSYWNEASKLCEVASEHDYEEILRAFYRAISGAQRPPDLQLLTCFADCLRQSKAAVPELGSPLDNLSDLLDNAIKQNELNIQHHLVWTIGSVLDAMVDIEVTDIDKDTVHYPLWKTLKGLKDHQEPRIALAARYALQALSRVPDNESPWQAFCTYGGTTLSVLLKIAQSAVKLDVMGMAETTPDVIEVCTFLVKVTGEWSELANESANVMEMINKIRGTLDRKGWYDALRNTEIFVNLGAFDALKDLILPLKCQHETSFWCGLYRQVERFWINNDKLRRPAEEFVDWTLAQDSVQRLLPSSHILPCWIQIIAKVMDKPHWKNHMPKTKRKLSLRFLSKKAPIEFQLQSPIGESPHQTSEENCELLQKSKKECPTVMAFFAHGMVKQNYISHNQLNIKRLSGETISINDCFINLSLIKTPINEKKRAEDSALSLSKRLELETPQGGKEEIPLEDLFNDRKLADGSYGQPNRILIRGRPGVGKTTLCKKITHDFYSKCLWASKYDRLYWIPLRKLKGNDTVEQVIMKECFRGTSNPEEVWHGLKDDNNSRALFVLDGLDEIFDVQRPEGSLIEILGSLLNRSNVIITSRPYAVLPSMLSHFDLEIETIGFHEDQVQSYIHTVVKDETVRLQINDWINQHLAVKSLVQIPIQLDAICFAWTKDLLRGEEEITTMTSLYQAIEAKLWSKDLIQLETAVGGQLLTENKARLYRSRAMIRKARPHDLDMINLIAFLGMHRNVTEFNQQMRDSIDSHFQFPTETTLRRTSFLRSSASAETMTGQDHGYYFIHLTFQEYFAGQYFVQQWMSGGNLETLDRHLDPLQPSQFLAREKYNKRYNVMWRFVAGILCSEAEEHLIRFLEAINNQRQDMFGFAHCIFLMNCFSEIKSINESQTLQEMRATWESEFAQIFFIRYEKHLNDGTLQVQLWEQLMETELPEQMLLSFLQGGSASQKDLARQSLQTRSRFSSGISSWADNVFHCTNTTEADTFIELAARIISCNPKTPLTLLLKGLRNPRKSARVGTLMGLEKHESLSVDVLREVVSLINDEYWGLHVLRSQLQLPDTIVQDLVVLLRNGNAKLRVYAILALRQHSLDCKTTLTQIADMLDDPDENVKQQCLWVLLQHSKLPDSILQKMLRCDSSHAGFGKRFLANQPLTPSHILEMAWNKIEHGAHTKYTNTAPWHILHNNGSLTEDHCLLRFQQSQDPDTFSSIMTKGLGHCMIPIPRKILYHCISLVGSSRSDIDPMEFLTSLQAPEFLQPDTLRAIFDQLVQAKGTSTNGSIHKFLSSRSTILPHDIILKVCRLFMEGGYEDEQMLWSVCISQHELPDSFFEWAVQAFPTMGANFRRPFEDLPFFKTSVPTNFHHLIVSWLSSDDLSLAMTAEKRLTKRGELEGLLPDLNMQGWANLVEIWFGRDLHLLSEDIRFVRENNSLFVITKYSSLHVCLERDDVRDMVENAFRAVQKRHEDLLGDSWDELGLARIPRRSFV